MYLDEADVEGSLPEALPTHIKVIFTDDRGGIGWQITVQGCGLTSSSYVIANNTAAVQDKIMIRTADSATRSTIKDVVQAVYDSRL